jgi:hypothetical protein
MGRSYSTCGRNGKRLQNFGRKLEGKNHFEELGKDGRIILK